MKQETQNTALQEKLKAEPLKQENKENLAKQKKPKEESVKEDTVTQQKPKDESGNGKRDADEIENNSPKRHKQEASSDNKTEDDPNKTNVLEKGLVYFVFKPRVNVETVEGDQDVQRLHILLHPLSMDGNSVNKEIADDNVRGKVRLINIPKKHLPQNAERDRFLGIVMEGKEDLTDLHKDLGENFYDTATRGRRHQGAGRPVGEGVYSIIKEEGTTHFAYILSTPEGDAQKEIGLAGQGTYIVSMRNPSRKPSANAPPEQANYPEHLMAKFGQYAWIPLDPPELLDYSNAQILFIGEKNEINDLGKEAVDELMKLSKEDEERLDSIHPEHTVFKDLKLSKDKFEAEPIKGKLK